MEFTKGLECKSGSMTAKEMKDVYTMTRDATPADNRVGGIYTRTAGFKMENWEHKGNRTAYTSWDRRGPHSNQDCFHSQGVQAVTPDSSLNTEGGNWVGNGDWRNGKTARPLHVLSTYEDAAASGGIQGEPKQGWYSQHAPGKSRPTWCLHG